MYIFFNNSLSAKRIAHTPKHFVCSRVEGSENVEPAHKKVILLLFAATFVTWNLATKHFFAERWQWNLSDVQSNKAEKWWFRRRNTAEFWSGCNA